MLRYVVLHCLLLGAAMSFAQQQTGNLQGKVLDENGEAMPYASVAIYHGESLLTGSSTDLDGQYNFSNIKSGTYNILVSALGYPKKYTNGVIIGMGETVFLDISYLETEIGDGAELDSAVVVIWEKPIIKPVPRGITEISGEDLMIMGIRDPMDALKVAPGVNAADDGEAYSANGSRPSFNDIYIDGIRMFGMVAIPDREIEQLQIITSGVPAEFGDANGAITNIITKGAPDDFSLSAQMESSQYLDAFGANTMDLSLAGPLWKRIKFNSNGDTIIEDGKVQRQTILGYRLSGQFSTNKDSRPSAFGSYRLSNEKLADILARPVLTDPNGEGSYMNLETIRPEDIIYSAVRPNARNSQSMFTAKLDYSPSSAFSFNVGAQGAFNWGHQAASASNLLVNSAFNAYTENNSWRAYGRMRHKVLATQFNPFLDSNAVAPVFQNLSYELQLDYSQNNNLSYDERFKDRFWEYGYAGQIRRSLQPVVGIVDSQYVLNSAGDTLGVEPVFGHAFNQIVFDGYTDAGNLGYDGGLAAYNQFVDFSNLGDMELMEVINGRFTGAGDDFFGLHNNAFAAGNAYSKGNSTQLRANVKANFDLYFKKHNIRHSIQVGGTYEQRIYRSYNLNPFNLWTLADQSANKHISNAADVNSPVLDANGNPGLFFDPISQRYYTQNNALIRNDENGELVSMTAFGAAVRNALNKNPEDWVNVHEIDPDAMQLSWFEPTTLIQGAQQLVNYYGYDYLGNPVSSSTSFNDFFTGKDENGVKSRKVAPFAPIYMAGYIQDNFRYKDIVFNLGLRFDHYDANTKVLKDPYSVTGYYTAAEFENAASGYTVGQLPDYVRPSNIGDDFAVYVNENSPDASIVGYRDGEQWYDNSGRPVNSPTELGTIILPALRGFSSAEIDPQGENYDPNQAFEDYNPNLVIMPRLSFAFPIGELANFYANYDVLAMRPTEATLATPLTYFNFRENADLMANPNLRSQRTINYEAGYEQALTAQSRVKFAMMYREERDLIQARQYVLAYPISYTSFGNDDFSTVKSFKVEYELRRSQKTSNNLRIIANYTLQFAEGTGSSPTSSLAVAAEELKYIFPLDFDQRHSFFFMADYRYGEGKRYNGPRIKNLAIFENAGINLNANLSSGTPYTRKGIAGGIGTNFRDAITDGSINGARLPWNFRVNLRVDKTFVLAKKSVRPMRINVYFRVQNLLDTRNILNVYAATGNPLDDGFLTMENSPGQGLLESRPEAYQMLYDLRMRNPFNISRPRRMFLGASFSF